MKPIVKIAILAITLVVSGYAAAQDEQDKNPKELCPMVLETRNDGLFQLVEVIGPEGDVGVAMPGDLVKIKCTIINLTDRQIMVSEEHITPQSTNFETRTNNIEEFLKSIPAEHRELTAKAFEAVGDGFLSCGPLELPKPNIDWGFSRRWILIDSGKDAECACGQRHMNYSKTIEVRLPDELWTSVTLSLIQNIPAILLGPEEHVTLKSNLDVTIERKK